MPPSVSNETANTIYVRVTNDGEVDPAVMPQTFHPINPRATWEVMGGRTLLQIALVARNDGTGTVIESYLINPNGALVIVQSPV
jgi:hypothetical protein